MRKSLTVVAALALLGSAAAAAGTFHRTGFSGDTSGQPTWQRPDGAGDGSHGGCPLSPTATATSYEVKEIRVVAGGTLGVTVSWDAASGFDGVLLLYRRAFDVSDQCHTLTAFNDDGPTPAQSTIAPVPVSAGQVYLLVMTGRSNADAGPYTGTTTGTASVSLHDALAFSGTTLNGPRWHRPQTVGDGTSGSCALSSTTTSTPYEVAAVQMSSTAPGTVGVSWHRFDGFLLVYAGAFDPADPCRNLIALNDDYISVAFSRVTFEMNAGVTYVAVLTGRTNTATGGFGGTFAGASPGGVVVAGSPGPLPPTVSLGAPYPNPAAGVTRIRVPVTAPARVSVAVFDALGREVISIAEATAPEGAYEAALDTSRLPAGVYGVRAVVVSEGLSPVVSVARLTVVR